MPLSLALFEPEIPQNTGTLLRLGACLDVGVDIIEPCGFVWNHPSFRRSVMDYMDHVRCQRYADFDSFMKNRLGRTVAVVVSGETSLYDFAFHPDDTLLFGKESIGIPEVFIKGMPSIHIPMPGRKGHLGCPITQPCDRCCNGCIGGCAASCVSSTRF